MEAAPLYNDLEGVPSNGRAFFVDTNDNKRIRFAVWSGNTSGTALVFPGRTEYIEKYSYVVQKLLSRGLNVVVIDWRGQGLSSRHPKVPKLGHVDDFVEYQTDLNAVLSTDVVKELPSPSYLFAHSMGGCIGLRSLKLGLSVKAAIFSGPMLGIPQASKLRQLLGFYASAAKRFDFHLKPAPTVNDTFYVLDHGFEGNNLTFDPEYYKWMQAHIAEHQELGLGGPTLAWIAAATREMAELNQSEVPDIPTLFFLGSHEEVVIPSAIRDYCGRYKNAEMTHLEPSRHEAWMETETIRETVWAETDRFLRINTE